MPFVWITSAEYFRSFSSPMPLKFLGEAFDSNTPEVQVIQYALSLGPMAAPGCWLNAADSRSQQESATPSLTAL